MTEDHGILTKAGKAQQRFLYVAGAVLPDGSARFEPFEVISTTEDIETRPKGGSYTLVVDRQRAERGVEKPFEPSTLSLGGKEQPRPFGLFVPYDETISRVTLRRGDEVLAERRPSAHSPEVAVTAPRDAVMGGRRTLSWSASDPDGAELTFSVWYSDDGGERWLPLGVGLRSSSVEIDFDRLPASGKGLLRVLASNGLNTTEATSESLQVRPGS